ncbi:type VI secretion system-associated FHA domain protein TagH [Sphingomonas sp. ac-8]|uniref:type VI secretion system-associated FHA domain protein TagH n=1 Tax=Sphingomonas sp. ac-8 TaxID=3242977 RepID=UPI003A7FA95B
MTLTLFIRSGPASAAAVPELVLDSRGGVVGRASSCDWSLADPTRHVSSRHFEIRYDGRDYLLVDCSTNGTFLSRTGERLSAPHRIVDGDAFTVGPFTLAARLSAASAPPAWRGWDAGREATSAPTNAPSGDGWDAPTPVPAPSGGWDSPAPAPTPSGGWDTPAVSSGGWDAPPSVAPGTSDGGWQPQIGPSLARAEPHRAAGQWAEALPPRGAPADGNAGWAPRPTAPAAPVASAWDTATPAPDPASGWSSAAPDRPPAPAPTPDDLWGRIAEGNVVDWARGGFGQPIEPRRDPLGLEPAAPPAPPAPPPSPRAAPPAAAPAPSGREDAFLNALGIDASRLGEDADARAALLFRRLVSGLVVMLEARARAKAQLGAEATAFSPDGHNPLKFARTPDEALAMLLGPPQPGFMPPDRAVEDAFKDLQTHQVATLRAMQGALRTTLERFSPTAIRARAGNSGVLERIVPAARDAALWQAYEREFGGVAQGSDEAFLDMFAKEFREAYNGRAPDRRP